MTGTRTRRLFVWALLVSLCLTGAIAIGTLLFAEFDDRAGRILATTALLALASLLGMPAGVLLDQGRARALAWALLGTVALGFAFAAYAVWGDADPAWTWKLAVTLGVAAGAGAQAAASTSRLRPDDGRRLRAVYWLAIVLGAAVAVLVAVAVWKEIEDAENYYRVLGATAVAAVLASLVQPLLRRASRRSEPRLRLVLELDREPSDEAVAAAVEALARHGVRADVVGRGSA